jgi:hypothetical protein
MAKILFVMTGASYWTLKDGTCGVPEVGLRC